jgi:integrase
MRSAPFNRIRHKPLVATTADDLLAVMNAGTNSTNHYLRRLHNLAVGMGWLSWPLLASRLWPKTKAQPKRAITEAEHHKIVATEGNDERRLYYELLWETGASQTDAATLTADNIDWNQATISYTRHKTEEKASLAIGARLKAVLRQLPDKGPLFPRWGGCGIQTGRVSFDGGAGFSALWGSRCIRTATPGRNEPKHSVTPSGGLNPRWVTVHELSTKHTRAEARWSVHRFKNTRGKL